MDILYLIFLNIGDFFKLSLYILPTFFCSLLSMWQTWAFIGVVFALLLAQSLLQYFLVDRYEKGVE